LFCGAGGSTTGAHLSGVAEVVACINHDALAIRSHEANYPECAHYTEDIRLFDEKLLPKVDIITMSAECVHFSIAKGGASRNADSRTLSGELFRYIEHCEPFIVIVENVKEFMTWSPLVQKTDKAGKPVFSPNGRPYMVPDVDKNKLGCLYKEWVGKIKAMGYEYQSRILNSADFGAYTSRKRYFGIFVKRGMCIKFPLPTHAKNPPANSPISRWKAVRDLLDFKNKGQSIFDRKTPLKENTLKRIFAGLQKFVPQSAKEWILKFLSNSPLTGTNRGATVEEPLHTITTQGRLGIAQVEFIDSYKTRIDAISSIESPLPTLDTKCIKSLVTTEMSVAFLDKYYGISNPQSVDKPCDTITTVDRFSLIQPLFIDKQFTNCKGQSIERALDTIMPVNKFAIVQGEFLMTDQYDSKGYDIATPHPTIVACDKNTWLIQAQAGAKEPKYTIQESDSEYTRKIKLFMQAHGISDIFMRMLCVDTELKVIQGFPADYVLLGTRKDRKKFVGNSVVPQMMAALIETIVKANI
jgi:DNA (cytosine-5)-methyltransferase 1